MLAQREQGARDGLLLAARWLRANICRYMAREHVLLQCADELEVLAKDAEWPGAAIARLEAKAAEAGIL